MEKGEIWLIELSQSNGHEQSGTRHAIVISEVSVAMVFQLRSIDKKRLKKKIGDLQSQHIEKIDALMRKMLKL